MTVDWEQAVVTAYGRNLTVALPATILAIKLVVRVIARERKQDVFRSVLVLPLDFAYIAMGLVLAAVARRDSAMVARYGANIDMAVLVLMLGLILVAILLTLCDRLVRVIWGKFFAAWVLFSKERAKPMTPDDPVAATVLPGQLPLDLSGSGTSSGRSPLTTQAALLLAWIMVYWMVMIPVEVGQMIVGVIALGSILNRLK